MVLPKPERLTRSSLFQRAYTARKSVNARIVTLYVLPRLGQKRSGSVSASLGNSAEKGDSGKSPSRMPLVGFVVAKKVCKSACVRNRAKRRLREAYKIIRAASHGELAKWYALVWVAHEKIVDAGWEEIQTTITDCLVKAESKFGGGTKKA